MSDEWDKRDEPAVEDVLTGRAGLLDRSAPPAPLQCRGCDNHLEWSWWPGRGRIPGRWCPPQVSPCRPCQSAEDQRTADRELNDRQERAGIPRAQRGFRWGYKLLQATDEPWPEFVARVRRSKVSIGVARLDVQAARVVEGWVPGQGGLFLHGPVGAGKSLWLAALVSGLIAPTEGGREELSVEAMVARGIPEARAERAVECGANVWVRPAGLQLHSALVVDEEEIVRRVELAWKGDQVPLLQIARVGILVYDDIGTVLLAGSPKARDLARTCLARLVDLRWREHRPLLATSNRSMDELCEALDERTASRLRALFETELELRGVPQWCLEQQYSWRRPPPVEAQ